MKTMLISMYNDGSLDSSITSEQRHLVYHGIPFDVWSIGELYNREEIQYELLKHDFPTPMQQEDVFLFAYLLWGKEAIKHLEGSYCFLIKSMDHLLAINDPLGLCPLYYTKTSEGYLFANHFSLLLAIRKQPNILSKEGIIDLFAFGPGIREGHTLIDGIFTLPMGSMLEIKKNHLTTGRIYHLKAKKHTDDLTTTIQKVHDMVTSSIQKQMRGAHASFLSGGLDSSIITAVCAQSKKKWRTYSLDYEGNSESFKKNLYQVSLDNDYIDAMLQRYPCTHTSLTITQTALMDYLNQAMQARCAPGMADVDASLLWLCQRVAQKDKIILSGECSDELFGGYPWFYREELRDIEGFPWLRSSKERIQLLHKDLQDSSYFEALQSEYENTLHTVDTLPSDTADDLRYRKHCVLVLHWFMQTLITRQAFMGAAANIVIRAPFTNVKLLEYVYNIPWSMKFLNGEEKGILRKAFENELPNSIAHRKKNPYPKTHNPLYSELIAAKLKECLEDSSSPLHELFDEAALQQLIETKGASFSLPFYGQLMSGPQLLAYIYQIHEWIQTYHIIVKKESR
ncbi:asparagine synthetase B family protein [Amedibacillus dolichus]|uniref:asparagine synthetase B family protein n=1 Tax=Amedibacillus dolichus TaxID=31971 RepID=UPI00241DA38A|nr:asparagine synthase-related protein [Amedibacillus dolichus]